MDRYSREQFRHHTANEIAEHFRPQPKFELPDYFPPLDDQVSLEEITPIHDAGGEHYNVFLPTEYNPDQGHYAAWELRSFPKLDEASDAVRQAREKFTPEREQAEFAKTYTHFFRIEPQPNGQFCVRVPDTMGETDDNASISVRELLFDTWAEARDAYLTAQRSCESLGRQKTILWLELPDAKLAFHRFDTFDPQIAPCDRLTDPPECLSDYFHGPDQKTVLGRNYRKTLGEPDWDKTLYSFVVQFLEKEPDGSRLQKSLGITHLDSLTPRQAIALSTEMVVALTKFHRGMRRQPHTYILPRPGDQSEETQFDFIDTASIGADEMSALEILTAGLEHRGDPTWVGNGVCRNFADCVMAVFDSLKRNQLNYNRLRGTSCFVSWDGFRNPRRETAKHAWNTFVTITPRGEASFMELDATWASRDLRTGSTDNLDYTLTRMEPIVYAVAETLRPEQPTAKTSAEKIFNYYLFLIEQTFRQPGRTPTGELYLERMIALFSANETLASLITPGLATSIQTAYDDYHRPAQAPRFVKGLWHLGSGTDDIDLANCIHECSRADFGSPPTSASPSGGGNYPLLFLDNPAPLQAAIFAELKRYRPSVFARCFRDDPVFRRRVQETAPDLGEPESPLGATNS